MKGKVILDEKFDLEINSQKRHERFIERIIENEIVWGLKLKNEDSWAVAPSNEYEDALVMVFWSDRAHAQRCAEEEWSEYEPTEIPLELFLKNWLTGLEEDGLLVGSNWSGDLIGFELEPIELLNEIINKMNSN